MVAKPVTVGVVGVLVLASALVLNYFVLPGDDGETATAVVAPAPPAGSTARSAETPVRTPASPGTVAAPASPVTAAVGTPPPKTPPKPKPPTEPSFDVVRVDPEGNTVLAGRGAPNAEIAIMDGGEVIGRVTTDSRGEWVFIPPAKLAPGQRVLFLRQSGADQAASTGEVSDSVVLVIPEKGKDIAGRPSAEPSMPLVVVVPKDDPAEGGKAVARVLQAPAAGPLADGIAAPAQSNPAGPVPGPVAPGSTAPSAGSAAAGTAAAGGAAAPTDARRMAALSDAASTRSNSEASTAPASTAPASTAPSSTAPASTTPASTAPASTTPASTAPASTAPVPTGQVAASGAPASQVPAGQTSTSQTSTSQASTSQASTSQASSATAPAGQASSISATGAAPPAAPPSAAPPSAGMAGFPSAKVAPAPPPAPGTRAPDTAAPGTAAPGTAAPGVSAYPEPAAGSAGTVGADKVAVDVIDYDDKGEVVFSGRSDPGARVEVFIDDKKVGDAGTGADGRWTMRPEAPVAPGSYQLRVDKVAAGGTVEARVAFPFVRANPLTELPNNRLVVIQPGNNLWRIATRVYGSGVRYVEIFDANKDQILDPDLIFPGQVFGLPRTN